MPWENFSQKKRNNHLKTSNMETTPLVVEKTYDAPVQRVWRAITNKDEMKQWYFDLSEFRPEVGFEFTFTGCAEEKEYVHLCKVTEVVEGRRIVYSWRYDGYPGMTYVTFDLREIGDKTHLTLTHRGLETFPQDIPDFAKQCFAEGWQHFIEVALKSYLEQSPVLQD